MSIPIKFLLFTAYLAEVTLVLTMSSVPPVSRDALTHHLLVPRLWIEQGGITEIPEILFSYYPQLIDLLYTIPLLFDYDIAAKYIHFTFALLTAFIIFLFVRRKTGSVWGALAGLLFLTIPLIVKLSVTVYVDLGLVFFTTGALFCIIIWLEDTGQTKWLIFAAICSGLALSIKYNAIVSFLLLSLLVPFFFLNGRSNKHQEQFNAIKFALLFFCISLLVFSPWLIRNYSLTGNPIYPLHHKLFVSQSSTLETPYKAGTSDAFIRQTIEQELLSSKKPLGPLLTRKLVYDESLPYTLLIPIRIFYEGKDNNPQYFDGQLNLLLLLLPLTLIVLSRKQGFHPREILVFTTYAALLIFLTFFTTDMRARYVATIIPPLVVLSTYALYEINRRLLQIFPSKKAAHSITAILIFLYFLPNFRYSYNLYNKIDPAPYLTGEISRSEYIQERRPEYATVALANKLAPKNGKVLGLYLGNRGYYFTVDTVLLNGLFTRIAQQSNSAEAISGKLKKLGFTHILLRYDFFSRWLNSTEESTKFVVQNFFSTLTTKRLSKDGHALYEISS